jgi:hypothetical protein
LACAAVWYDFEPDGGVLGGRIVAQPCGAWTPPRARFCPTHGRQLAQAARLGLAVPDPAAFPPAPAGVQAALL